MKVDDHRTRPEPAPQPEGLSTPTPTVWEFGLVNYRTTVGDIYSLTPTGKASNRIDFVVEGRTWTLVDNLHGSEEHKHPQKIRSPQISGTLSTEAKEGEEWGDLLPIVEAIGRLLSFALCTWVPWVSCSSLDGTGQRKTLVEQGFPEAGPYSSARIRVAQHGEGTLKSFLESSYPHYCSNFDVLDHGIGVYVAAQLSNDIIVKTALLNMLLDSLQDDIHAKGHSPQIDEKLPKRLDEPFYRTVLHALLSTLSGNWTLERTNDVVNRIKEVNARPGFVKAVRKAFESLGINGFEQLKLGTRHKLMHKAYLNLNPEDKLPYLFELDYLIFLMLSRLLGYTGKFYHQHLGAELQSVADVATVIDEEA